LFTYLLFISYLVDSFIYVITYLFTYCFSVYSFICYLFISLLSIYLLFIYSFIMFMFCSLIHVF